LPKQVEQAELKPVAFARQVAEQGPAPQHFWAQPCKVEWKLERFALKILKSALLLHDPASSTMKANGAGWSFGRSDWEIPPQESKPGMQCEVEQSVHFWPEGSVAQTDAQFWAEHWTSLPKQEPQADVRPSFLLIHFAEHASAPQQD